MKSKPQKQFLNNLKGRVNRKQKYQRKQLSARQRAHMTSIGEYLIDLNSQIGGGAYGRVYRSYKKKGDNQVYACKRIGKNKIQNKDLYLSGEKGKSALERLMHEIDAHQSFSNSTHIVKLYDVQKQQDAFYLFMEYCQRDLGKQLSRRGSLPQDEAMEYFRQLLQGYKVLYDRKVSHRDLKPQNLLLHGNTLKIADFGFVKQYENPDVASKNSNMSKFLVQSLVGTPLYMAPQILKPQQESNKKKYNPHMSDVWSMGIILFKMLYGIQPYTASQGKQLYSIITTTPLKIDQKCEIRAEIIQILQKTIQKKVAQRITFKELYKLVNQYFKKQQELPQVNEKQKILTFYNKLVRKISFDSANYATLREIGIDDYQKFSARLMTLIHDCRDKQLQEIQQSGDVAQQIKNESAEYHNTFYQAIKQVAQLQSLNGGLQQLLEIFQQKLQQYEQFEYLHKDVQYYLLLLLLLCKFFKKQVTINYIYTILQKQETLTLTQLKSIKTKLKT